MQQQVQQNALQLFMQNQAEALQAQREQLDASMRLHEAQAQQQFQEAMQAQRDQARADALAAEARLDAIRAEMTYQQVTQQQHVDAQTAAIQASAQAVAAQQHAIDTTANAAQTAATAMATQVTAPRANTSSAGGALPLPPSTVGVDMLDTAEQDPIKLSINWRALEQSLRLRAKNFSLSLSLSPTMRALKPAVSR